MQLKFRGLSRVIGGVALLLLSSVAQAATITLSNSAPTVSNGEQVEVAVSISGLGDGVAPSLGGYSMRLLYDGTLFQFDNVLFGDPILGNQLDLSGSGSFTGVTDNGDSVDVFELSFDDVIVLQTNQAPEFILFRALFTALADAPANFSVEDIVLSDELGQAVDFVVDPGQVADVPEPSSVVLALSGLTGVLALRRRRRGY